MFYYNLAYTYKQMGKEKQAKTYLDLYNKINGKKIKNGINIQRYNFRFLTEHCSKIHISINKPGVNIQKNFAEQSFLMKRW